MNAPLNLVSDILYKKGLNESLVYNIIHLVYHEEHQFYLSLCFDSIITNAFTRMTIKNTLCSADIETAVKWFYDCNCCERHSFNKAVIDKEDLLIVTKPCVFTVWRYNTDIDYYACECNCRHLGRRLAREFLKKNDGNHMVRIANGTNRPFSLGIRSNQ